MYSPIIPRHNSWTPPKNKIAMTVLVQPFTHPTPKNLAYTDTKIPKIARPDGRNPIQIASRSGTTENDTIPSVANRIILYNGYFVLPANRAARRYITEVCEKPNQLTIPRTNRSRSG